MKKQIAKALKYLLKHMEPSADVCTDRPAHKIVGPCCMGCSTLLGEKTAIRKKDRRHHMETWKCLRCNTVIRLRGFQIIGGTLYKD